MYLNGSQLVFLSRVVVHHNNKIIANMALFIAASFVALPVWHQRGDVENSCAEIRLLSACVVRNEAFGFYPGRSGLVSLLLTLHDVVVPTVGELSVVSVLVQPAQEDLVGVAVFQVDEFAQPRQEGGVAVRPVLV